MRYFLSGSVLVALAMVSGGTLAQNLVDIQTSVEANARDGVSSQARVDALDDQTDELTREYRAALKQLASLREYNAQLEKLIAAQKAEMISIRRQIDEVTNVDRTITPLMTAAALQAVESSSKGDRKKTGKAAKKPKTTSSSQAKKGHEEEEEMGGWTDGRTEKQRN